MPAAMKKMGELGNLGQAGDSVFYCVNFLLLANLLLFLRAARPLALWRRLKHFRKIQKAVQAAMRPDLEEELRKE